MRLLLCVSDHVSAQHLRLGEGTMANVALKLATLVMDHHVTKQVGFLVECPIAHVTHERLQSSVRERVSFQVMLLKNRVCR